MSWRYKVCEAAETLAQGQTRHDSSMHRFPGARHNLPSALLGVRRCSAMNHTRFQMSWCYKVCEAAETLAQGQTRYGSNMHRFPGARHNLPSALLGVRHCLSSTMRGTRLPSLGSTRCATQQGVQMANNKQIPLQPEKGASNPKLNPQRNKKSINLLL
ncbi:hypothetical protein HAX54_031893 [Datura stramonium]|uniref:Uncharacterized protein n=1 Tax=Datura stramonium TaxID=4076 RepID=A0ABS8VC95_DATST|nr:hypothetical protein [Datura stramonium]